MKVLKKLTLRSLLLNRKRAGVTVIGIILATALITTVANLAESFRASMIAYEKAESGNYHYRFCNVSPENQKYFEENENIEWLGYSSDVGYAKLAGGKNPDKPYLFLWAMDEKGMEAVSVSLIRGRLPENSSEVIISETIGTNGGVNIDIGDTLTLEVGERKSVDGITLDQSCEYAEGETLVPVQESEYTVVGIMERLPYGFENRYAPGYTCITGWEEDGYAAGPADIYVSYTKAGLKKRMQVTAGLLDVSEELYRRYCDGEELTEAEYQELEHVASYCECNIWLLKWELMLFSDTTLSTLYAVAAVAIAIIIVAAVFSIRNSFMISLTEKMKLYGMLSSIGMTKKQRKKLVYQEALLLGCVGIPLGIACSLLATFLVIRLTGHLLKEGLAIDLVFIVSIPAIILGILLSAVTLFWSAGQSARKAAKVSPMAAIRGNETVKIHRRELRTPKLVEKWFGIGGKIAYKNLRRARVKYRTTVISIVVSVAVFIAMTTFTRMTLQASSIYYNEDAVDYQLVMMAFSDEGYEEAMKIKKLEGVDYAELLRMGELLPSEEVKYSAQYLEYFSPSSDTGVNIAVLDEEAYENYCNSLGLSPEKTKMKAILIGDFIGKAEVDGKIKRVTGMMYDYQPGDIFHGVLREGENEKEVAIEIALQTEKRPVSLGNWSGDGILVVSEEWAQPYMDYFHERIGVYIQCGDPDAVEAAIENEMHFSDYMIENLKQEYEATKSLYLLINIFLYSFIIVIALIGITNIFNTITTNMELRAREFATLKSVGMTGREFRRMIWLEGVFYGGKALLIGIPIGLVLSMCFHMALLEGIETPYEPPYSGILISIIAVFLLLFGIMRYSMGRINRQNLIETIQNENI